MPITITHIKSLTEADGADTTLVRPSDWNSSHTATLAVGSGEIFAASYFAAGNTTAATSSTTQSLASLTLSGAGGLSVGYSGNTVVLSGATTAAAAALTQTLAALGNTVASTTSETIGSSLSLSGAGGVSVGFSGGTVILSGATTAAPAALTQSLFALGNTVASTTSETIGSSLSLSGAGIVSVGYSGGTAIVSATTAAAAALTQTLLALGNTTGSTTSQTIGSSESISGAGIVSVGFSGGTMVVSATSAASATSAGYFALGNTTNASSTSESLTQLSFSATGGISVGYSGNTVLLSAAVTNNNFSLLGNTTANNSSTTVADSASAVSGAGAVSVGFSGTSLLISAPPTITLSFIEPMLLDINTTTLGAAIRTLFVQPILIPNNLTFNQMRMIGTAGLTLSSLANTNVTSSQTASAGQTLWWMIYSRANSTSLTLVSSTSATWGVTQSLTISGTTTTTTQTNNRTVSLSFAWPQGTVTTATTLSVSAATSASTAPAGTSSFTGTYRFDLPFAASLTAGVYFMGQYVSSTTAGQNISWAFSSIFQTNINSTVQTFGAASAATNLAIIGLGIFNVTSTVTTNSVAMTNISTSTSNPRLYFYALNET